MIKKSLTISILTVLIMVFSLFVLKEFKAASATYIYGYPLVLMDKTRLATFGETDLSNQFYHIQKFPDHTFRNVVRPNNDTLYSVAWLDLTKEAQVLSVPDMPDRYYVMPLMDAWTNVFASVGTRQTGREKGDYLITGPQWRGAVPPNMTQIKSPTTMVWMIGRIQTNGTEDIPNVSQIQTRFSLSSIANRKNNIAPDYFTSQTFAVDEAIDPYQQIDLMDSEAFFSIFSELLITQATLDADADIFTTLKTVGIIPGEQYDPTTRGWLKGIIDDYALTLTRQKITEKLAERGNLENGWVVIRKIIGRYGTHYKLRSAVARIGLGALPPEEAVYPNTEVDFDQQKLSGEFRYKLHFDANELPPAQAFWSLTLYNEEGFLVDNPLNRYSIGGRDDLGFNEDGSLDIVVQHRQPQQGSKNWLPAPAGQFALTMRLYMPEQRFLDGLWKLPPVKRY